MPQSSAARSGGDHGPPHDGRWKALVFVALAQLMVVLDATVVNVALPAAQHDLGITDGNRHWVITAYALAFGALLLFGGRVADLWGRKRTLLIGLFGFTAASVLGGCAPSGAMMFGARALQGAFAALLAPAALSLLTVMFTGAKERAKAFGIYSAISSGGGAVGFIAGGFLTQYLDWRWTFFINVPIALAAAAGAWRVIREPEGSRNRSTLDVTGVVLSSLGLVTLVYGFTRAGSDGWDSRVTIAMFVVSAVLLLAFVAVQRRAKAPLLSLRVVTERSRGSTYVCLALANAAMFGTYLFLTYYLQVVKGYSPLLTGAAYLPMVLAMMVGSTQIGARLMTRLPPRLLMGSGFLIAGAGMLLLPRLHIASSYATTILPAMLLLGFGMGVAGMSAMSPATQGVEARDAGSASAMINTSQRVGGATGAAWLNTVAASATATYRKFHVVGAAVALRRHLNLLALMHGYGHAIWFAAIFLGTAGVISLAFIGPAIRGRTGTALSGSREAAGAGRAQLQLTGPSCLVATAD